MSMTTSEILAATMAAQGLSVTAAARKANVDRTFLQRLVRGARPPKSREGRMTAEHDPRYAQLRDSLGLGEAFIEIVKAEQIGRKPRAADKRKLVLAVRGETFPGVHPKLKGALLQVIDDLAELARLPDAVPRLRDAIAGMRRDARASRASGEDYSMTGAAVLHHAAGDAIVRGDSANKRFGDSSAQLTNLANVAIELSCGCSFDYQLRFSELAYELAATEAAVDQLHGVLVRARETPYSPAGL